MFLDSYLDESYDSNSDLIVAGFVASVDQWAIFAEKWKTVLDEHGLPYFHFLEFNKHHLSFEQRTKLLSSLIKIITECVILAVSSRISPSDARRKLTFDQFAFCTFLKLVRRKQSAIRKARPFVGDIDNASNSGFESLTDFIEKIFKRSVIRCLLDR